MIRRKFLRIFEKHNFWDVKVKEYSNTLGTQRIFKNQFYDKTAKQDVQTLGFQERNKILDSLLSSDISPYINRNSISLLKSYMTLKRNARAKYSFVVDYGTAEDIVKKILPELKEEKSIVVEANPGLGLITLNLMKSQVPKIHIYENSKLKSLSLQQLLDQHPDKLHLENHNIFIPRNSPFFTILDNAVKLGVKNKIIGVVQQFHFFTSLVQECVACSLWDCIQFTEFFVVVSKTIWKNVMQDDESCLRYSTYCFFNLVFETELLAEYPTSAFLPYTFNLKEDKMFLVKISKKANFPGEFNSEEIKSLFNFCKVLGRSKYNYIIPTVEQWIPGCGPYLISKGISVTNQINDLSYNEFKQLYLFLRKFRGFQNFGIVN